MIKQLSHVTDWRKLQLQFYDIIRAQRHHLDITCWARGKRARHCRPTLIWCHKTKHVTHMHSAFSAACFQTADCSCSKVSLRVDQGLGPKNTGTGRKWVAVCAPHHCHFELVCGPLRSQANEPAKSQITCFSDHTGGLQESINLRLEGACVWIMV